MRLQGRQLRLYLVTDSRLCGAVGVVEAVKRAISGGVSMVQLRDKTAIATQRYDLALALKAALVGTGVPLIINDDVELAIAADVDGVHIGQNDVPPEIARARIGRDKILGFSCGTPAQVMAAAKLDVDYLGVGPIFTTSTKPDHATPIGIDGLAACVEVARAPVVAIGGLGACHVKPCLDAGAAGLAVVSAICGHADPERAARQFVLQGEGRYHDSQRT